MEESEKRKERLKAMSIEAEVSNDVEASAMPGFESIDRDCRMTLVELRVLTIIPTLWQHFLLTRRWATVIIRLWKGNNLLHLQLCIHRSSLFAYLFWFGGIRDFNRYLPLHQMQTHFSPVQGVYNLGPYNPRITRPSLMRRGQSDSWNGSQASDNHNIVSDGTPRGMFEGSPGFNNGTVNPRTFGNSLILDRGPRGRRAGRGQGFRGHSSASNRILGPESYSDESMLEDPWRHLKPFHGEDKKLEWMSLGAEDDAGKMNTNKNNSKSRSRLKHKQNKVELLLLVLYAIGFYAFCIRRSLHLSRDHFSELRGLRDGWLFSPPRLNEIVPFKNQRDVHSLAFPFSQFTFPIFTELG
ncbi:hypothetical protein F3Y22_tig00110482pilonHSYRG00097 [Hibiscus syriacus]|uniref:Uncharacterized protein n=1 Tax=Hibiscus syriacus TaxID=106335 RepID=A0A6A3AEI8_HIBSY|nr:hypothetical protein F3Y22_tig00110482pilonHSYRG00097 [Hibiscus syriacus]